MFGFNRKEYEKETSAERTKRFFEYCRKMCKGTSREVEVKDTLRLVNNLRNYSKKYPQNKFTLNITTGFAEMGLTDERVNW